MAGITLALALLLGGTSPGLVPQPMLTTAERRILHAHNAERERVGVSALQWDAGLAASAASYGPALASAGRLSHSPHESRPGQRENLWMGTRGAYSPEEMVGSWIAERSLLRPGTYPAVSATGRLEDVSHYTQLVWPTTTRVGCAVHSSATWDYLVCRYSPPGNGDGLAIPVAWLR